MGTPYCKYRDEALYSKVLGVLCDCKPRTEREIRRELGFDNRNQRLDSLLTGLTLQPEPITFDGESFVIA
jgi:hypothetical protein